MTQVISFHYTASDAEGQVIDSSHGESPMAFLEGTGQVIPGLEKVLTALAIGEKKTVALSAAEAYGLRDPRKVVMVPRSELPEQPLQVGDLFQMAGEEDESHSRDRHAHGLPFRVIEVDENMITLDGNHPLAGIDLICDVQVTDSRPATDEELTHGHAHSGDDPHHH